MASDTPGDASVSVSLPESLSRWLDDKAAEEGRSREDVLLQLLSAYRKVDGMEEGDVAPPEGMDGPADGLPTALEAEIESLVDDRVEKRLAERQPAAPADAPEGLVDEETFDQRIEITESRFVDLLEDVRERVVQVKHETDEKAPADHDHPDVDGAVEAIEGIETDLQMVSTAVDALETRLETGFANYEEILESLADSIDRTSSRQLTLAKTVVETREELRTLAARDTARSAIESLKREANQHGVRTADCEDCGTTIDLGLLTRPECPHCAAPFEGIEPSGGFFGSNVIAVGKRPALEAPDVSGDGFEHGVDDIIDGERTGAAAGVREELDGADDSDGADDPDGTDDGGAEG